MARWTAPAYEAIFAANPPTEPRAPTRAEAADLGARLGFSPGAILAQWNDGRDLVLGNLSAASEQLRGYLRRRGWLT